MANVLTEKSAVKCPHSAAAMTVGRDKLRVKGEKVLVEEDKSQWSFPPPPGCSNKPPPVTNIPCTGVASLTETAKKLRVGGSPVVLDNSKGKTNGSIPSPMSFQANQVKLTAV